MSATQALQIAARLHETRDTVRRLYGDDYTKKVAPYRELARAAAATHGCSVLAAVTHLKDQLEGFGMVLLLAAAVEETEAGA